MGRIELVSVLGDLGCRLASAGRRAARVRGGGSCGRSVSVGAVLAVVLTSCTQGSAGPENQSATSAYSPPASVNIASCEGFSASGTSQPDGLPQLRLPCLVEGEDVQLANIAGRPTLINLWATWCAPCRAEMPLLQRAYETYGDRVGFLGVNTLDDVSLAVEFLDDVEITYAHVVDADGGLMTELGLPGLPVTLAVNAAGRVITRHAGPVTWELLSELMTSLLADEP